jgi:membrane protein
VNSKDSARPAWLTESSLVVATTYANWRSARTIRLGAGIAYYSLFAIIPLLSLSVVLAQLIVSRADIEALFLDVADELGIDESLVQSLLDDLEQSSIITGLGIVGFVALVIAALLVFWAVQDAFDEVWEIPVQPGAKATIWHRLRALSVVGGGAVLIVLILVINSVSSILKSVVPGDDVLFDWFDRLIAALTSWVVLVASIAVLFQVLTRVRIKYLALGVGAAATAVLLTIGTTALGFYLSNYAGMSLTGAAAGVLFSLSWFYYVSQMVLVGAHFTRVLDERGSLDSDPDTAVSD